MGYKAGQTPWPVVEAAATTVGIIQLADAFFQYVGCIAADGQATNARIKHALHRSPEEILEVRRDVRWGRSAQALFNVISSSLRQIGRESVATAQPTAWLTSTTDLLQGVARSVCEHMTQLQTVEVSNASAA